MRGQRGGPRPTAVAGRPWRVWWLFLTLASAGAQALPFETLRESQDPALLLDWGKRYLHGVLAPQDLDRAIQLYCGAARLGSGEAQFRLGEIYARSLGGKRDEVLAAAWLLRAALSRYDAARALLARWDLSTGDFPAEPPCVLKGQMQSRTLPSSAPPTTAPPAPGAAPSPPGATGAALSQIGPSAPPSLPQPAPSRAEIEGLVRALAPGFGLKPELVLAVIQVESNFVPSARSSRQAQGLMQLIPATARRFGVADPWDPQQNLRGGMAYLRWLIDHFAGDLPLALAGYNAGEEAVRRHGGIPPYQETRNYVQRIAQVLGLSAEGLAAMDSRPPGAPTAPVPRGDGGLTTGVGAAAGTPADDFWKRRVFPVDGSG